MRERSYLRKAAKRARERAFEHAVAEAAQTGGVDQEQVAARTVTLANRYYQRYRERLWDKGKIDVHPDSDYQEIVEAQEAAEQESERPWHYPYIKTKRGLRPPTVKELRAEIARRY